MRRSTSGTLGLIAIGAALLALYLVISGLSEDRPVSVRQAPVFALRGGAPAGPSSALGKDGRAYVPVYSSVPTGTGQTRIDLTVTLSVRNRSETGDLLVRRLDYFSSEGSLVRSYVNEPRSLRPLGTAEVVIAASDLEGGTSAKFLVEWQSAADDPAPVIEAVMLGVSGSQGFSFLSPGHQL